MTLPADDHVRRVVARLLETVEAVERGERPLGALVEAAWAAVGAADHAHPEWLGLLTQTALDADAALTPWPPVADRDLRTGVLAACRDFSEEARRLHAGGRCPS